MFHFYLLLTITNIIFIKNEKLIFAETFSRHGARAPIKTNDTGYDLMGVQWKAPGELTALGKRMEYILGLYNRRKYILDKELLSKSYDPHELIVYSSDINRTLLSMTSQLQGMYPASNEEGNILKPGQYDITSYPPFNLSIDDFKDEIKNLNDSAIPNYMNIIPIHFITLKNGSTECSDRVKEFNDNNAKNFPFIANFTEEFNKNYTTKLNELYHKPNNSTFDYAAINAMFDTMVVDITEGNNITGFFKENDIDMDYFMSIRYEISKVFFRDFMYGDEKSEVILFYDSLLFKDMLNYMKRRIEDDINDDISYKNVSDFSRPKMVMISAHDTTLSAIEMFFIRFFGIEFEKFELPVYTSQIAFEITRDENITDKKSLRYSDYMVSYYFNEKLMLNVTFDKFVETIESAIWNQTEMDSFCFPNKNENKTKKKNFFTTNKIIMMCMGLIILILIIIIIVLGVKLSKKPTIGSWLDNDKAQKFSDERIVNDDED